MIAHLRNLFLLSTPVAPMLLTLRWASRRKDVKQLSINKSKLKLELSILSAAEHFLVIPIIFLCTLILSELNYITKCLCVCLCLCNHTLLQQGTSFYIALEYTSCLFVAYCHVFRNRESCDGFVLLVEREFYRLFDSLITGRSFENLSYLSSCSLSQRWRFRRIHLNILRGIESYLACTKVSGVVFQ